jgi:hypothetical protein
MQVLSRYRKTGDGQIEVTDNANGLTLSRQGKNAKEAKKTVPVSKIVGHSVKNRIATLIHSVSNRY